MPDVLGPGGGFDSPDPGPSIFPVGAGGGALAILPASTTLVNSCNRYDGTPALPIFGADTLVVQATALVAAFPSIVLTVQYSADGIRWESSGVTINSATPTRLNSASGNPTGYRFARVIVTTASGGSEQLINITVTALKTGT